MLCVQSVFPHSITDAMTAQFFSATHIIQGKANKEAAPAGGLSADRMRIPHFSSSSSTSSS